MVAIMLALVSALIAYNLCKEDKITTLIAFNFILNMLVRLLEEGINNVMFYAICYLIYSIIVSYLALLAYKLSSSFIGFIIIAVVLNIAAGFILSNAIGTIIKI